MSAFKKSHRIKSQKRIKELLQKGRRTSCFPLTCISLENDFSHLRIAISIPKRKIKNAVKRNYIRRVIQQAIRKCFMENTTGDDHFFIYNGEAEVAKKNVEEAVASIRRQL